MLNALMQLARPALLALDPETAHETTLRALEKGLYPADRSADPPTLAARLGGLALTNPIAIAAGFDKDARVPDAVLGLGCGFAEIGTVTPLAQAGNPQPRVFRLINERGVINRLGFNNGGHAAALARLKARPARGIVGVNIGANKDATDRTGDYVTGIDDVLRRRQLLHRQHLVAQHAGPARPPGAGRPRRTARPRDGGARSAGGRRQAAPADRRQDRARYCGG